MKWTPEVRARIVAALHDRMPDRALRPCSVCGTTLWDLGEAIIGLEGSKEFFGFPYDHPSHKPTFASRDIVYPCVVLTCTNCGNTHLLNVRKLGLDDLIIPEDMDEPSPPLLPPQSEES